MAEVILTETFGERVVLPPPQVTVDDDGEYNKFSERRKWCIVGIVSFLSFLGPFSSTAVLPAVPEIAAEFHTTGSIINYSNAAFLSSMAISPCLFSPISQVCTCTVVWLMADLWTTADISYLCDTCVSFLGGNRTESKSYLVYHLSVSDRFGWNCLHCDRRCCH